MMKILAFAASNSKTSINKQLATYAASLLKGAHIEVLDLNDYELPLYSIDKQAEIGEPSLATEFLSKIGLSDAIIISFAEHNGSYTAAYKNLFDWCSRINRKVFQGKSLVLLSTSPGPGGAANVLATASQSAQHFDGHVKAILSIPNFFDNFDIKSFQMTNKELDHQLRNAVLSLL